MRTVTFTVTGNGVSGNHYKQPMASSSHRGRQYVTSAAATFKAEVYGQAFAACTDSPLWRNGETIGFPEFVRVDVSVCNMRLDRDNAVKVLYDALQGVCYLRDSFILDGGIRKVRDKSGPRYEVTVTEVDVKQYYHRRKRDVAPISHAEWVLLQTTT